MSSDGDDVLSAPSEIEFSGFETDEIPDVGNSVEIETTVPKIKSVVVKKPAKKAPIKVAKTGKTKPKTKKGKKAKHMIDLNNLSGKDISSLREKLGISPVVETEPSSSVGQNNEFEPGYERVDVNHPPRMTIQVDASDLSDCDSLRYERNDPSGSNCVNPSDLSKSLNNALFGDDSAEKENADEWTLPKFQTALKGNPVNDKLAELVNSVCTGLCDIEGLLGKYNFPENCDKMLPPLVNSEIWRVLDKRTRIYDKLFCDIQNVLAKGMVPILKLAEILKPVISKNSEAKEMLSDTLTLLGQVQMNLSLRRRYLIRPNLRQKYKNLCNISMPITTKLFGDDVAKDIKNCDTGFSLANERYPNTSFRPYRGRSAGRFSAGKRYQHTSSRHHPYQGQFQARGRASSTFRGRRGRYNSPNDW